MIAHGHRLEDVSFYTLAQVRLFVEAIARRERAVHLQQITAARMAQFDAKGFKAALAELERGK